MGSGECQVPASIYLPEDQLTDPCPRVPLISQRHGSQIFITMEIKLNQGQLHAYNAMGSLTRTGGVAILTGKAGTGKSAVTKKIRDRWNCIMLAPTGLAAINVQGQTIHSFFGLRPGDFQIRKLSGKKTQIVRRADLILIDEAFMVRADLMDQIDQILKLTLDSDLPFGGKAVLLIGDPWQLEPVVKDGPEADFIRATYRSAFCFDSRVISSLEPQVFELTENMRQKGDEYFIEALNSIREGGTNLLDRLNTRIDKPKPTSVILTFTNGKADAINNQRLREIQEPSVQFEAELDGKFEGDREFPAQKILTLKVGARVMMLVNSGEGPFVNGDLGKVIELDEKRALVRLDSGNECWVSAHKWEKLEFTYEAGNIGAEVVGTFEQLPIRLAWATTVHKSQGQTYDAAHIELETSSFSHGQLYVAVSRVRTLAGLSLGRAIQRSDNKINPRVRTWQNFPAEVSA